MMGRQDDGQDQFLYHFQLDDYVPEDHLLRYIDRVLDLTGLRDHLEPFYSHTGRPSVDPELMIRMLLIGYCFGIRSERRLCEEVHLNLAWLLNGPLTAPPRFATDHPTFPLGASSVRVKPPNMIPKQVFSAVRVAGCAPVA